MVTLKNTKLLSTFYLYMVGMYFIYKILVLYICIYRTEVIDNGRLRARAKNVQVTNIKRRHIEILLKIPAYN